MKKEEKKRKEDWKCNVSANIEKKTENSTVIIRFLKLASKVSLTMCVYENAERRGIHLIASDSKFPVFKKKPTTTFLSNIFSTCPLTHMVIMFWVRFFILLLSKIIIWGNPLCFSYRRQRLDRKRLEYSFKELIHSPVEKLRQTGPRTGKRREVSEK